LIFLFYYTFDQAAALQGEPTSQAGLALCYQRGYGVEQSLHDAAVWYEKAAEQVRTETHVKTYILHNVT
jgi:TPR repeat protein